MKILESLRSRWKIWFLCRKWHALAIFLIKGTATERSRMFLDRIKSLRVLNNIRRTLDYNIQDKNIWISKFKFDHKV